MFNTIWILLNYLTMYNKYNITNMDCIFHWLHSSSEILPYPLFQPYPSVSKITVQSYTFFKIWTFWKQNKVFERFYPIYTAKDKVCDQNIYFVFNWWHICINLYPKVNAANYYYSVILSYPIKWSKWYYLLIFLTI